MDIIQEISSHLGIDTSQAQAGVGALFATIQHAAPAADFQALLTKIPEAASWISSAAAAVPGVGTPAAAAAPASGGGGFGSLLGGAAGGLFGAASGALGSLGQAAEGASAMAGVVATLGKLGIPPETAMKMLPLVAQFLQSRAHRLVL